MTANWFATIVIFAWPIVAIFLYRKRSVPDATLWTILGALLLLPANVSIKMEMIPAFDKNSIPSLCALIGCIAQAQRQRPAKPGFGIVEILAVAWVLGPVFTSMLNGDDLFFGGIVLPGVGYYDGISALLSQLFLCLPFFIGRRFFQRSSDTEAIMRVLVVAGLLYSLPMLFEIRMSPVLSSWIYGYFPSGFGSEMRYGGFRPVVFMKNGLTTAFFVMTSLLAAVALWRVKSSIKPLSPAGIPAYLGVIVVLCKSAGALVYAAVIGAVIRWLKPKAQVRLAVVLVSIGLLYPALRLSGVFPSSALVETAMLFSQERADSLRTRFDQEQQLLTRASQRILFGWGRYGRNRIYDEDTGKDLTLADGAWMQVLGQFGMVGFVAQFGLLALPVFQTWSVFKFVRSTRDRVLLAVLALIAALDLVEQIPNSSMSAWNWLLAGALLGRAEYLRAGSNVPSRSLGPNGLSAGSKKAGEWRDRTVSSRASYEA